MHFMMTLCSIMTILGIICLAIVSYGLPVVDENDEALHLKNFGFLNESAGNETLASGDQEVPIEITEEVPIQMTEEVPIQMTEEVPIQMTEELPIQMTEELPIQMTEEVPVQMTEEVPIQITEEVPIQITDFHSFADLNETGSGDEQVSPDDENVVDIGPPPYTDYAPDLCKDATIDTITRTKSGSTYVFKGDFYWKVHPNGISERYPRKISDDWDGLEGNLDASLTWSNGKTFFFKDRRYWRFTDKKMDRWYPKLISVGFEGIPDNLDAALLWGANGKSYFFKGDKYWRYDMSLNPQTSGGYPRLTRAWGNVLEDGIHAAFQWENKLTYLFKDKQYYRYNDMNDAIEEDPPYPRSTAIEWFGCHSIYYNSTEIHYSAFLDS